MQANRFHRNLQKENNPAMSSQRRWPAVRGEAAVATAPAPDLTDFMNDMFFGTPKLAPVAYNLTGTDGAKKEEDGTGGKSSNTTRTSRLTQEWLDEAKRLVAASSPEKRYNSPSKMAGSPRFASSQTKGGSGHLVERRDPHSRSARRNRAAERVSEEILSRTARHVRNNSESFLSDSPTFLLSATAATAAADRLHLLSDDSSGSDTSSASAPPLPPRQPGRRKSRFHDDPLDAALPRRSFRRPSPARSSSASNHETQRLLLSPPKNLVESANRRSISSSTCSQDKIAGNPRRASSVSADPRDTSPVDDDDEKINSFLRRQKAAVGRMSGGLVSGKARIILSGSSTSTTSSMVAAICYAWLLENSDSGGGVVVPVVNMKRAMMCKHKQAAWLFHVMGIDASALLFADEVDLEGLLMSRQLNILVVGQDILRTNGEVGSQCTVLTDNYCENAYDLLQTPNLKKLLLAGILLDTQNLDTAIKFCTNRDAEAVQLLLVDSAPSSRHELFEQLMRDQRDNLFLEAMRRNYGKTSSEDNEENVPQEDRRSARKSASISSQEVKRPSSVSPTLASSPAPVQNPAPARELGQLKQKPMPALTPAVPPAQTKALDTTSRAKSKNKFSFAKLFGFGSK